MKCRQILFLLLTISLSNATAHANEILIASSKRGEIRASVFMTDAPQSGVSTTCSGNGCNAPILLTTYWTFRGSTGGVTTYQEYYLTSDSPLPSCPFDYLSSSENATYANILMQSWNSTYGQGVNLYHPTSLDTRTISLSTVPSLRYQCDIGNGSRFSVYFSSVKKEQELPGASCTIGDNDLSYNFNLTDSNLDGEESTDLLSFSCSKSGVQYSISLVPTQSTDQIKLSANSYATVNVGGVRLSSTPTSIFLRQGSGNLSVSVNLHGVADSDVLTGNSVIILEPL